MTHDSREREYVRKDHCPACGHYLDCASEMFDAAARPKPFDLTVCMYCSAVLEFNPGLKLQLIDERRLTPGEKGSIARIRVALKKAGSPPSARRSEN